MYIPVRVTRNLDYQILKVGDGESGVLSTWTIKSDYFLDFPDSYFPDGTTFEFVTVRIVSNYSLCLTTGHDDAIKVDSHDYSTPFGR